MGKCREMGPGGHLPEPLELCRLLGVLRGTAAGSGQRRQLRGGSLGAPLCTSNDKRGRLHFSLDLCGSRTGQRGNSLRGRWKCPEQEKPAHPSKGVCHGDNGRCQPP